MHSLSATLFLRLPFQSNPISIGVHHVFMTAEIKWDFIAFKQESSLSVSERKRERERDKWQQQQRNEEKFI